MYSRKVRLSTAKATGQSIDAHIIAEGSQVELTVDNKSGTPGRIRTYDLDVRTVLLYPLSYQGMHILYQRWRG